MSVLSLLALLAVAATAAGQSLVVVNRCSESVLLFTQNSYGSIANFVYVRARTSFNMGISSNWVGALNVGTGCNADASSCTTGGPYWDGFTPFSRAEFNFGPGGVNYDISLIYGYNVGMEISPADASCAAFACTFSSGCPVPGPDGSCYSSCCSSVEACAGGALPAGGGGCIDNGGPGPYSWWYNATCPNAYSYPDNDGADGYPAGYVDTACGNTDVTLTLCPGTTSHY